MRAPPGAGETAMRPTPVWISIAVTLMTLFVVFGVAQRGVPRVVATNLENLPMMLDGYSATEDRFEQSVYDELNADRHVYRHYRNAEDKQIDLYIGYYGTAKGGRTGHNPYACLPGSGWGIVETGTVQLKPQPYQDAIRVNYILAKKDSAYESVLHWYQTGGTKILESGLRQNIQRFTDRVFRNRNDGAFIRVSAQTAENGTTGAKKDIAEFSDRLLAILPDYWPVEQ